MWSGNFKTALLSLRSAKWRSVLTMMGIIIGVSSVVTVVSLGEGLKQQVVGQINRLGSDVIAVRSGKLAGNSQGSIGGLNVLSLLSTSTLTNQDVTAIGHLPSVAGVTPINFVTNSATGDNGELNNVFVIGTSPELPEILSQKVNYGDFFSTEDADKPYAVIGSNIAQNLFGEINPVGHTLRIANTDFSVRGVLAPSAGGLLSIAETDFNSAVFIPLTPAQALSGGRTNILQILAKSKASNPDAAVADIKAALLKTHGRENFTVLKQRELLNIANSVVNVITSFISGIAATSLLVGGIGIMDIMLVSVSERTREIGVRKAVGATNRQVLGQFLVEGLALSVGGGLIGIIVSLLINAGLRVYTNLHPIITIPVMILAVGVSVAIGIIFSVAPALKAARKNPIDALRNE